MSETVLWEHLVSVCLEEFFSFDISDGQIVPVVSQGGPVFTPSREEDEGD